jgi:hypothetical protein
VISENMFTMLVLVAMITTAVTSPAVRALGAGAPTMAAHSAQKGERVTARDVPERSQPG